MEERIFHSVPGNSVRRKRQVKKYTTMNKTIFNMRSVTLWNKCHFGPNILEIATRTPTLSRIARFSTKDPKKSEALKVS